MMSQMPKSPMASETNPIPSASSGTPKVKRWAPLVTSVPIMPSSRPSTIMPTALIIEPEASTTDPISPKTMSEKYSAGPNLKATSESGTASTASTSGGEASGDERAQGRNGQRGTRAPLARHLVAVQAGDHRGGFARHIDQDGGG